MGKFKRVPIYEDIKNALDAFDANNNDLLRQILISKYRLNSSDIDIVEERCVGPFIKSQANIFSNKFVRVLNNADDFDTTVLDEAEKRAERLFHLFQKVGMLVTQGNNDPLLDNENELNFYVLSPLQYHHEGRWWVYNDEDGIFIFKAVSNNNQEIEEVYLSGYKSFQETVLKFDDSVIDLGVKYIETNKYSDLKYVPIIELTNPNVNDIIISPIVNIEKTFINQLTFGLYNIEPKLVTQYLLKSDTDPKDLQSKINDLLNTTKLALINNSDSFDVLHTGDIKVIMDTYAIHRQILEQMALKHGVDISAIVRNTQSISGESKKFDLSYINRIRNDFKIPCRNFDKRIFNLIKENYGLDYGWENLIVNDLEIITDRETEMNYATNMRKNGFWTHAEAVSYVRQVSVEEAEQFIQTHNIVPNVGIFE